MAVALVFAFHLWPDLVPGGYVGVDVFFVISGYLIAGGLLHEAESTGRIALAAFYARRVRRLLPAATLVLVAVAAAVPLLPVTRWEQSAVEIAASALYVENWVLAIRATDYFTTGAAATPVRHYWSLSLEEQFYLLWPLLMLAGLVVVRRARFATPVAMAVLFGAVFVASLAASAVLASRDPAWGYFVTHGRLWELALGGLLAFADRVPRAPAAVRAAFGSAGVVAILVAAFAFSPATPFPGFAALLPTGGAAFVILFGGAARGFTPTTLLGAAPLRYLGDRSYSIYLWHWPAIVFYAALSRTTAISPLAGLAIVAAVLVVSDLSWRHVEERFRRPRPDAVAWWRPWLPAAGMVGACVVVAAAIAVASDSRAPAAGLSFDPDYPGPAALLDGVAVPEGMPPLPTLAYVKYDFATPAAWRCHRSQRDDDARPCTFGDPSGAIQIALVGDSHALQWVTALIATVEQRGWGLTMYTKSVCPFAMTNVVLRESGPNKSCSRWRRKVLARLFADPPDVLVTSQYNAYGAAAVRDDSRTMAEGLSRMWKRVLGRGIDVVAIRDTPRFERAPVECLAEGREDCGASRSQVLRPDDPILGAADGLKVRVIDLTDAFCTDTRCDPVVGNVIVYRDNNHITATYARMLAPALAARAGF